MIKFYLAFLLSICFLVTSSANDFDERRSTLIDSAVIYDSSYRVLPLQAYRGLPINISILEEVLDSLEFVAEADFRMTSIVRMMYFSDGQYDEMILSKFSEYSFWLPDEQNIRQYWSENHMIMWMSANWLLKERYEFPARPELRDNLIHWLKLKKEYGFYEFFSSIYWPFTAGGILNLVDFCEDEEIQALAEEAITRLLKDMLLMANDEGVFYPTAGRNDMGRYRKPYGSDIQSMIHLLTGLGEPYERSATGSAAIATSSFDFTDIMNSWKPVVNTTLDYGHPLSKAKEIHASQTRENRIIFQWSSGGYFHPTVAEDTWWLLNKYKMWKHKEFTPFSFAQYLPIGIGSEFATLAASITRSSYIGNPEIKIYKNKGVVLTSSQDLWKGRLGYQIYPMVATVGTVCTFTRSGNVEGFNRIPARRSNVHLPYVEQDENVALVMYRPNWDLSIWVNEAFDVALYWADSLYEEVRRFDNWILGRNGDSYVAVRKHCNDVVDSIQVQACDDADGQTWAFIVGNLDTHGNFDAFEDVIREAKYKERWYFDWQRFEWVYYGKIKVDGKKIDYHWRGSLLDQPVVGNKEADGNRVGALAIEEDSYKIYPNPASDFLNIQFREERNIQSVELIDITGKQIYYEVNILGNELKLDVQDLPKGLYSLKIAFEEETKIERVVIQ